MYKVFLKNKPLIVSTSLIDNTDLSPLIYSKFSDSSGIIKALKSKKTNCVYFYNSDPEKLMKHLNKKFSIVEAAGGMVVNDKNQYLLIYRNSKWDLPKGHLNKNELTLDCAFREVTEETGVRGLTSESILPTTFHFFKRNNEYKIKKTYWFLMKTKFNGILLPQLIENIEKADWKNQSEVKGLLKKMYPNIEILFKHHFNL